MFVMTHRVNIFDESGTLVYNNFKANSLRWIRSVDNFCDSGAIKIPARIKISSGSEIRRIEQTATKFKEGMKVEFYAGYDGDDRLKFKGFISRIDFSTPVELQLEGYSYQIRKINFSRSFKDTTLKVILTDLITGTDIKLSQEIPEITFKKVTFPNYSGLQVLEWVKDQGLLVFFKFDVLYVGAIYPSNEKTARLRLGWNTVSDNELRFENIELSKVKIVIQSREADGSIVRNEYGKGEMEKVIKTTIKDEDIRKAISERVKKEFEQGYRGTIKTFLIPHIDPGMNISIEDTKYPNRQGLYYCPKVQGEFSPSGGRQTVSIGFVVSK